MARFYDPRREKGDQPVDTPVGLRGRLEYNPSIDSGTSGSEVSDLKPGDQYDVDARRLSEEERPTADAADTRNEIQQRRVNKYLSAVRLAGKYQEDSAFKYPIVGKQTPRLAAQRGGVILPSLGEAPGSAGSTNYPNKPQPRSGKPYNWRDVFS